MHAGTDEGGERRVLGIDPGTRVVGWAVVARRGRRVVSLGQGTVRAAPRRALPHRLADLAGGLREVIRAHRPTEAAVEEAFQGRSARDALRLGEGRGAVLLLLAEAGLPVTDYPNNVVKRAVTGAGRASKEQVRHMVLRLVGLAEAPPALDASDALAVAVCHLQRGEGPALPPGGLPPRLLDALRRGRRRRPGAGGSAGSGGA